ncbi:MAG: hypothetical protein HYX80_09525, partial [Chloroflexi bacterium]|nr:hypothetical protein [Chloroflexota bacterium]
MDQIHRRFTVEQIRALLEGYGRGRIDRAGIEEILGIGKTRFFALLKAYRQNPKAFSISYHRVALPKLTAATEGEIARELMRERELVNDNRLPISSYNYSAL